MGELGPCVDQAANILAASTWRKLDLADPEWMECLFWAHLWPRRVAGACQRLENLACCGSSSGSSTRFSGKALALGNGSWCLPRTTAFWKHNVLSQSVADPIKRNLTTSYNDTDVHGPVISRRRRNHRRGLQCCAVAMPATAPVERAEGVAGVAAPPACVEGESSERARQREIAA